MKLLTTALLIGLLTLTACGPEPGSSPDHPIESGCKNVYHGEFYTPWEDVSCENFEQRCYDSKGCYEDRTYGGNLSNSVWENGTWRENHWWVPHEHWQECNFGYEYAGAFQRCKRSENEQ